MIRRDALGRMLDVVGLDVSVVELIECGPGPSEGWVRSAPTETGWIWVATRFEPVWVEDSVLERGEVVLLRTSGAVRIASSREASEPPAPAISIGGVDVGATGVAWGTVRFGPLADEVLQLPAAIALTLSSELHASMAPVLRMLEEEWRPDIDAVGAMCDALARVLVLAVLRTGSPLRFGDDTLKRALAVVHAEPIDIGATTIDAMALACGLPRRSFVRRFEEATRLTPGAYAAWWRMTVARSMLAGRAAGTSIRDVASACGYRSASAFGAAFVRIVGETPERWASGGVSGPGEDAAPGGVSGPGGTHGAADFVPRFRRWHDRDIRWTR